MTLLGKLPAGLVFFAALSTFGPCAAGDPAELCIAASPANAVSDCEKAVAEDSGNLALLRKLAWAYLASYRETDAIALFTKIVEQTPDDPQSHFDLAATLAGLRLYEPATAQIRTAIRLDPDRLIFYRLASVLFEQTGDEMAAFDAHLRLAEAGVSVGMFDLAEDFALGHGTFPDQKRARHWYQRAAEAGHVMAMLRLAEKLEHGAFGDPPDLAAARHWRLAAKRASAETPPEP